MSSTVDSSRRCPALPRAQRARYRDRDLVRTRPGELWKQDDVGCADKRFRNSYCSRTGCCWSRGRDLAPNNEHLIGGCCTAADSAVTLPAEISVPSDFTRKPALVSLK